MLSFEQHTFCLVQQKKTVIIIAGPTAVGKTAVGIAVAKYLGTEIISADSRQCFKELAIGVARPSSEELHRVSHHFIASHSIHQKVTAATFESYALAKASEIFTSNDYVVMVGGTGLYVKAFAEGMDPIPEVPEAIHATVVEAYKRDGLQWLQAQIEALDPLFYERGEMQNPQRLMRALEVIRATGQSILSFRTGQKKERNFTVINLALDLPRAALHQRINDRVDGMIEKGLLQEVESLRPYQDLNALQTVGYKELFDYFNEVTTLPEAIDAIKRNTRHYAKRQLTWFRKHEYQWLPPDAGAVLHFLSKK